MILLSLAFAGEPVTSARSHHEVVRLEPGDDPRARLTELVAERGWPGATVVSAVGTLAEAHLRFADPVTTYRELAPVGSDPVAPSPGD